MQQDTEVEVPIQGIGNPPNEEGAALTSAGVGEAPPTGAGEGNEGGGAPGSPPPAKDPSAWKDKRIGKLTARQAEMQRELEAAQRRVSELETPTGTSLTEADVEARAQVLARTLAAQEQFNRDCIAVAKQGKEKFNDFDSRVGELAKLVDRNDREAVASYAGLIASAIKTGAGPEILHQLGGDLEEAERLLGLGQVDQALALGRLANQGGERISNAPEPIKRVQAKGPTGSEIAPSDPARADKLSNEEWMKRREAEVALRRRG